MASEDWNFIDDIIVTNSLEEAQKFAKETFFKKKNDEVDMLDEKKEAEREEQRKAAVTAVSYLVLIPFFNIHTGC
eukprot:2780851-Ditylum_brightwellii.AAC.1